MGEHFFFFIKHVLKMISDNSSKWSQVLDPSNLVQNIGSTLNRWLDRRTFLMNRSTID